MASPTFDLDELQKQMQTLLPAVGTTPFCCCQLVDPSLQSNDHLDDCELRLLDHPSSDSSSKGNNDGSGNPSDDDDVSARRRKHRESMARLRRGWRTSIAALQHQEQQLQALLRRAIVDPATKATNDDGSDPLETLRQSYRELVAEQLRLQEEHANLEAARAHKEKYERLLERELARVRLFSVRENDA